ncbi:hypothetical protein TrLO_g9605 [Triparma laevis f. longispina]|uniref:Uncharacterized protein n=1 Tax=Triparma laevis f. longispina TaxID=1714387 RepID=A0A9W7BZI3_9STRA|nr:hypothetical protein TrLO_g9605 [Triparma laevis f. longispina]
MNAAEIAGSQDAVTATTTKKRDRSLSYDESAAKKRRITSPAAAPGGGGIEGAIEKERDVYANDDDGLLESTPLDPSGPDFTDPNPENTLKLDRLVALARAKYPPTHVRRLMEFQLYDLNQRKSGHDAIVNHFLKNKADPRYEYLKIAQKNVSYEQHLSADKTLSESMSQKVLKSGFPVNSKADFIFPSTYSSDVFHKPPTSHQIDDDVILVICSLVKVHLHRLITASLPAMQARGGDKLKPEDLRAGMGGKGGTLGIAEMFRTREDVAVERNNERSEAVENKVGEERGVLDALQGLVGGEGGNEGEGEVDNPLLGPVEKDQEKVEEEIVCGELVAMEEEENEVVKEVKKAPPKAKKGKKRRR